ncbi:MAG: protein kinase [Gammaproteobacteria bacterium]
MQKAPQENNLNSRNALPAGYELLWYQIKSVLGQGAFGITYLARDINLDRLVAIKEFLPGQYAMRDGAETVRPVSETLQEKFTQGLQRFIDEARILDQFEHPNIVRIMNIFEANNSAYMVMGYEQGVSLKEVLIRQKFLDESDLLNILFPILDGLEKVHQAGFIHRDIKPANIFIRTDGSPVLLDFGSARQSLEKETHTLTSLVSPGYAPIEQYVSKSDKQGPWSDIYGMAATLYRAVTGVPPSDAITRGEALTGNEQDNLIACHELADKRYSSDFIKAIDHGLAFLTRDRPQTIKSWRKEFLISPELLEKNGSSTQQIMSGRASGKVVSIVKESLTQTVTRLHDEPELTALISNEDPVSVESMELAHKAGFRRGLKLALVILVLLFGGFFIGNFQKMQQAGKPGFVPQDVISDKPVEVDQGQLIITQEPDSPNVSTEMAPTEIAVEELSETPIIEERVIIVDGERVVTEGSRTETIPQETTTLEQVAPIEEIGIISGSSQEISPLVLDEQTAAELAAEGKIIIVDEAGNEVSSEKQPEVVSESTQSLQSIPQKESVVKENTQSEINKQGAIDAKKEVAERNKNAINSNAVVIEEVYVPPPEKVQPLSLRFKKWMDSVVGNSVEERATNSGGIRERLESDKKEGE